MESTATATTSLVSVVGNDDQWTDCVQRWQASLQRRSGRANTIRAYLRDLADFRACFPELAPWDWDVSPSHAERWVEMLTARGLAPSTRNRKIASLSSLYHYAATEYVIGAGTDSRPLWPHPNPFGSRALRNRNAKSHAQYPSAEQVEDILSAIDLSTVTGLRNLAIIAGLFATTRRVSEWVGLRWGDIHQGSTSHWFEYRYKGGQTRLQVIPPMIWEIIEAYLRLSGRWPLADADYVFVALSDAGERFNHPTPSRGGPLSSGHVNRVLKSYGGRIGIPAALLHCHALRHAGARYRRDHGADVWDLQSILGHSSIAITQQYTERVLSEPHDPLADAIASLLPRGLRRALNQAR